MIIRTTSTTTTTTTEQFQALEQDPISEISSYDLILAGIYVDHFIDSPNFKTVDAYTRQIGKITLWEGEAYDAIGDWTTQDAENRIKELLGYL